MDDDTRDRVSALGRVAILTSASEQGHDAYVEVTTADLRVLLDERRDLADKLAAATSTVVTLAAQRDAMETVLNTAYATINLVDEQRDMQTEADLRAARDMFRRPDEPAHHDRKPQ